MDEKSFLLSGERCDNLCRATCLREGRAGRSDDVIEDFNFSEPIEHQGPPIGLFNPELMLPGENSKLFSSEGSVLKRDDFPPSWMITIKPAIGYGNRIIYAQSSQ